jgi:4-hydroxythreonine-4-phosphate dehydrogenase
MTEPIAIILGEPNSISSEIIFKSWKKKKKFKHRPCLVIGNYNLLCRHLRYFKFNLKLKLIEKSFKLEDLKGTAIPIIDVKYSQKKIFEKISKKSNKFILNCFTEGLNLLKQNKILGIINGPVSKETLLNNKFNGMTEFIAYKIGRYKKVTMLIYNKKLAVTPITTHIPIKKIFLKLNVEKIVSQIKEIVFFYNKYFKKKIKIAITGLNPHCFSNEKFPEEEKIIKPAIKKLKKQNINITGPLSADTLFLSKNQKKYDVIVGMYHDQILTPFKTIMGFKAINITLGLPFIRISPDHGVAVDIVGKKIADPSSLIESIKFFNNIQ